jgi:methylmalonyl-CoA mutase N-terminal domain/subunit
LSALEEAAQGNENLMPLLISAVEAYATLGEISDALRRVFGEQREFRSLE